jgi:hypothetical protein
VDPLTLTFAPGGNALFERPVKQALGAARFAPAIRAGRKVPTLVSQAFQFRIVR